MKPKPIWALLAIGALAQSGCAAVVAIGAGTEAVRTVAQERTTMDALRDAEIQLSLNNRYLNHSKRLFGDVSTDVTEGRVVLTGTVPTREEKVDATRLAWETPGVKSVTDELVVAEDSGTIDYIDDAWISNQLRFRLVTDGDISSVNYNVVTVDKVVHITGIARSVEELSEVIAHAQAVPGVAQIVNHVLTIDDPRRIAAQDAQTTG